MTTKPTITIDKNVPIPPPRRGDGKWMKLLITVSRTESFVVNTHHERQAVHHAARVMNMQLATRKLNGSGYRIWRVK